MNSRRSEASDPPHASVIELRVDRPANGGSSVGRDDSGRAVFCEGALPGELVRVELLAEKKRYARGQVVEVLDAAPGRVEPSCETHTRGCGGCDLAHSTPALQRSMKRQVVVDALTRIARVDESQVEGLLAMMPEPAEVVQTGYRTTVRAALRDGRSGYRRRGSREVVVPTMCGVAHPDLEDLLLAGRFKSGAGDEVVLRVSAASGERLAVVDGDVAAVDLPSDVTVTSRRELAEGRSTFITEEAAGRSWRVSAGSFFQAGPTVATALVDAVAGVVGEVDDQVVVDAYAGIGLFGGTVGSRAARLISVEESGSSSDDARVNLAGIEAEIVESRVEQWTPERADVVIADPARAGLRAAGVAVLDRCDASRFVLVSCDTGSLGRDVGLLVEAGYALESLRIVDAFPDTGHVETIVGLSR